MSVAMDACANTEVPTNVVIWRTRKPNGAEGLLIEPKM